MLCLQGIYKSGYCGEAVQCLWMGQAESLLPCRCGLQTSCEPGMCCLPCLPFPQRASLNDCRDHGPWGGCSPANLQAWSGPTGSMCFGGCFLSRLQPIPARWASCSLWPWDHTCKQCMYPFFFLTEYLWVWFWSRMRYALQKHLSTVFSKL